MRTFILCIAAVAVLTGSAVAHASEASNSARSTLKIRSSQFGPILFDGADRALYAFTRDRRGRPSTCYGACAAAWPPYYAKGALRAARGVKRSLIKTVRRRSGRLQITYNGWPLYYYAHEGPGEIKCQNVDEFGGLWLVVRPSGRLVR